MIKLYNLTEKNCYKLKIKMKTETKEILLAAVRRLVRNFIGAFLVTFVTALNIDGVKDIITQNFLIGFSNGFSVLWATMIYPAIISAFIAGFTAVGKLTRDILREKGFENIASKIIF